MLLLCYFVTLLQARWRGRSFAALWIRTGPEGAQLRVWVRWTLEHSLQSLEVSLFVPLRKCSFSLEIVTPRGWAEPRTRSARRTRDRL